MFMNAQNSAMEPTLGHYPNLTLPNARNKPPQRINIRLLTHSNTPTKALRKTYLRCSYTKGLGNNSL